MGRRQGARRARILKRYVTDEQRSRRPIFIATLRAAPVGCFSALLAPYVSSQDTLVAHALKNSQLAGGETCTYFGDRTPGASLILHAQVQRCRLEPFTHPPKNIREDIQTKAGAPPRIISRRGFADCSFSGSGEDVIGPIARKRQHPGSNTAASKRIQRAKSRDRF